MVNAAPYIAAALWCVPTCLPKTPSLTFSPQRAVVGFPTHSTSTSGAAVPMIFNAIFCFLSVIDSGFCQTWEQLFRLPFVAWPRHGIQNVHGPHFYHWKQTRFNSWSHDESRSVSSSGSAPIRRWRTLGGLLGVLGFVLPFFLSFPLSLVSFSTRNPRLGI